MPTPPYRTQYQEILARIRSLQQQLEQEFDQLLSQKREQFRYKLRKGKVTFDRGVKNIHQRYRINVWAYLKNANPLYILTAPVIYSVVFPLLILDAAIFIYQQVCFRTYGIPRVKRSNYIVIDRHHLSYLNGIEKLNCLYCSYGNGLVEYVREVFARTEQFWCPIKHARRAHASHHYTEKFIDYGDAEHYQDGLYNLRQKIKQSAENNNPE